MSSAGEDIGHRRYKLTLSNCWWNSQVKRLH